MSEFYLHEDEWGMTALEPVENLENRRKVVAEAAAHSEAHRAPGGLGWTAIYVAPESPISIATREITLAALAEMLGPEYVRASKVVSGYSSYREDLEQGFAFLRAGSAYEDVFYGTARGGVIVDLNVSQPTTASAATLHAVGTTFRLLLCDLWTDTTFPLADRAALDAFLVGDG